MNRDKSVKNHRKIAAGDMGGGFGKAVKSSLKGLLISLVIGLVLVFAAAAVCYSNDDPDKLTIPLSLAALYMSALVAGFTAVRKNGGSALLCGILSGLFLSAFYIILSLIFKGSHAITSSFPASLGLRALITVFSIFGAFLGLNLKKSGNPKKKRR